jgi:hypothetical protein
MKMAWNMRVTVTVTAAVAALAVCAMPGAAAAQAAQPVTLESFAGTWEGAAQTPNGDVALRSVFKFEGGKLSGTIESSMGPIPVTAAALEGDKLLLTIDFQGASGTLACKVQGNRMDGVWAIGENTGSFWLARGGTAGAAAGDSVAGTWAGEVEIGGQAMPFSLVLRASGDALAGEVSSAAGTVPLGSASWKDGTLQLAFPYTAGEPVTMTAQLKDGKLAGTIDYNKGEAVGTWTASRKQ